MSKLQNKQDSVKDLVYRRLTPPEYQQIHRHNDAVETLTHHQPKDGECRCGLPLTEVAWAEHMADILFPVAPHLLVEGT